MVKRKRKSKSGNKTPIAIVIGAAMISLTLYFAFIHIENPCPDEDDYLCRLGKKLDGHPYYKNKD